MAAFDASLPTLLHTSTKPRRIVSTVPSQTELLAHFGLDREVVGITKFCVHPQEWFRTKQRIGGTKNLRLDDIRGLQPDLILANKEENERDQIEALAKEFPVHVTDVNDLESALQMMQDVGRLTHSEPAAKTLIEEIAARFEALPETSFKLRTAYLIWKDPYMSVGGDTFIADMLRRAGFANVLEEQRRYLQVTLERLAELNTEVVLLSSEPYPFKEKDIAEIRSVLSQARVLLVDGELFSWYGSRLLHTPAYLRHLQQQIGAMH